MRHSRRGSSRHAWRSWSISRSSQTADRPQRGSPLRRCRGSSWHSRDSRACRWWVAGSGSPRVVCRARRQRDAAVSGSRPGPGGARAPPRARRRGSEASGGCAPAPRWFGQQRVASATASTDSVLASRRTAAALSCAAPHAREFGGCQLDSAAITATATCARHDAEPDSDVARHRARRAGRSRRVVATGDAVGSGSQTTLTPGASTVNWSWSMPAWCCHVRVPAELWMVPVGPGRWSPRHIPSPGEVIQFSIEVFSMVTTSVDDRRTLELEPPSGPLPAAARRRRTAGRRGRPRGGDDAHRAAVR